MIFTGCSLHEARFDGCDLSDAAFEECDLRLTEFDGGTYRGCDLRGNDLSGLRGVGALKKVIVDRSQLPGLAQALAADLEISVDQRPSHLQGRRRQGLTAAVRRSPGACRHRDRRAGERSRAAMAECGVNSEPACFAVGIGLRNRRDAITVGRRRSAARSKERWQTSSRGTSSVAR
ncbi:pentapeptide repeat-containing protein [Streptosporangium sandarakinum]|uniref:pentapeptide repeat-containing protein n=1 Tax=Streptosporangium sandarakinum TaxID=1260955 RepID=UPI0034388680